MCYFCTYSVNLGVLIRKGDFDNDTDKDLKFIFGCARYYCVEKSLLAMHAGR